MWKNWFGFVFSLALALMPYLGFPREMKDIFYTIAGILFAILFFMLAKDRTEASQ